MSTQFIEVIINKEDSLNNIINNIKVNIVICYIQYFMDNFIPGREIHKPDRFWVTEYMCIFTMWVAWHSLTFMTGTIYPWDNSGMSKSALCIPLNAKYLTRKQSFGSQIQLIYYVFHRILLLSFVTLHVIRPKKIYLCFLLHVK